MRGVSLACSPLGALVHVPCCNYSTHTDFVLMTEWTRCPCCSMDLREVLGRGDHLRLSSVWRFLCRGVRRSLVLLLPGSGIPCELHGNSGGRELISCPMCPESVRDHVSVEWFQRLCAESSCHTFNLLQFPTCSSPISHQVILECGPVASFPLSV